MEIDTVEKTGGHITNLDLFVDAAGTAHLLYLKRPYANPYIREKYFPQGKDTAHLQYVVVKDGKVSATRTLAETTSDGQALTPSYARFHVGPREKLYVVASGTMNDAKGEAAFGMFLAAVLAGSEKADFQRLDLKHPLSTFFTNTPRGGSKPGEIIDLFGTGNDAPNLRYTRIRLK
jgi:hypothetical protein